MVEQILDVELVTAVFDENAAGQDACRNVFYARQGGIVIDNPADHFGVAVEAGNGDSSSTGVFCAFVLDVRARPKRRVVGQPLLEK